MHTSLVATESEKILLQAICHERLLGEIDWETTTKLVGGRIHEVWRLKTDQFDYVIKLLNRSRVSAEMLNTYKIAENISQQALQQGVNAVTAVRFDNEVIFTYHDRYYLLFPYIQSTIIKAENIQPENATKMGELVANLHKCQFNEIKVDDKKWEYAISPLWHQLIDKIHDESIRATLNTTFSKLNAIYELDAIHKECINACQILKTEPGIISHGDLDTPNIVWKNDEPHIIDWEYSGRGRIHSLRDLITTALYWSQVRPDKIDLVCYEAVLNGYQKVLPFPDTKKSRAALYAVLGGWMQWIDFNIQRLTATTTDTEQKQLAAKQIEIFVNTVITVKKNEETLLKPYINRAMIHPEKLTNRQGFFNRQQTIVNSSFISGQEINQVIRSNCL